MNKMKIKNFNKIISYFPLYIKIILQTLDERQIEELCEIRIKENKPITLVFTDRIEYITSGGRFTTIISNDLLFVSSEEIQKIFSKLCNYSIHSYEKNISNGYITISGGNRVGVYGTAVCGEKSISSVKNIKGLNFRVSGEFVGVAERITEKLYSNKNVSTLICGPPSSGKTTYLRDMCRCLSDNYNKKIAIIDERVEFDGYNVGINSDVLIGYPKSLGIQIAVRTLSPDIIVCDEIGTSDEISKISDGMNCGVSFILSIHSSSVNELKNKPQFIKLKKLNVIDYCIFVDRKRKTEIIYNVKEKNDENIVPFATGNDLHYDRAIPFI